MPYRTEVREVIREVTVTVGADCDQCHAELEPVYADDSGAWATAPKHALLIRLIGGYGLYFDSDPDAHVLLCKDCANRLTELFPCIEQAINIAQGA